ncbi:MAG: hypothetical protein IAE65_11650 [Ignavibacteria bacterium]|nr:hypothetical protein [Ignavibacteria bacterium]
MPSINEFLKSIAKQLIIDFENISEADHPVEKGNIGESSSKKNLVSCLPGCVCINSGFVMDSFGGKSLQTDLIISENACPSFSLGHDVQFRYYPCEGVCAIGEVKSILGKTELEDCYKKINSVKSLRRNPLRNSFRKYGSNQPVIAESTNALDVNNPYYQIFGFVLCKSIKLKEVTIIDHIIELDKKYFQKSVPDLILALENGIFIRTKKTESSNQITFNSQNYDSVAMIDFEIENFPFLIHALTKHIQEGTTTCESPIIPYLSQFDEFDYKIMKKI